MERTKLCKLSCKNKSQLKIFYSDANLVEAPAQGKARQGKARQGKARQGKARQGKARQGKARQGKARRTEVSNKNVIYIL
ncbi:hypothetical protein ACJJI4_13445 [Microbulbifer sp. TRSA002]|uniref:hypothetical protein n=1 Tax=Microbulbifer sp. TRSA002 TaxID=3243382 RepID=UPI004039952E